MRPMGRGGIERSQLIRHSGTATMSKQLNATQDQRRKSGHRILESECVRQYTCGQGTVEGGGTSWAGQSRVLAGPSIVPQTSPPKRARMAGRARLNAAKSIKMVEASRQEPASHFS